MITRRDVHKGILLAGAAGVFGRAAYAASASSPAICTVIQDGSTKRDIFREGEGINRFSPCSTFKVPLALMGYDAGILKDAHTPSIAYRPEFMAGRDLDKTTVDPTLWLSQSVVWYSQHLTREMGMDRFRDYVRALGYGNLDLSGNPGKNDGLTQAWLDASLLISPDEQVAFVHRMLARQMPLSPKAYDMTGAIMPAFEAAGGWAVRGKTGSGSLGDMPHGWFVGWAEKAGRRIVFARHEVASVKSDKPGGPKARDALLGLLGNLPD